MRVVWWGWLSWSLKRTDLLAEEAVGVGVPHQVRVLLLAQVGRRAQPTVALDVDLVRSGRRPVEGEESGVSVRARSRQFCSIREGLIDSDEPPCA